MFNGEHKQPDSTWGMIKMRSKYYVPALEWLPNYSLSLYAIIASYHFPADLISTYPLA
jgi:hypothetical protein